MVGDLNIRIAKLAFHAKESPFRTRDDMDMMFTQVKALLKEVKPYVPLDCI